MPNFDNTLKSYKRKGNVSITHTRIPSKNKKIYGGSYHVPIFISFFWLLLSNTLGFNFLKIEPFYPGMIGSFIYYFFIIRGHQWQLK